MVSPSELNPIIPLKRLSKTPTILFLVPAFIHAAKAVKVSELRKQAVMMSELKRQLAQVFISIDEVVTSPSVENELVIPREDILQQMTSFERMSLINQLNGFAILTEKLDG